MGRVCIIKVFLLHLFYPYGLAGKKVKAKSLLAGGNSGDHASPHFTDQLIPYTKGVFKEVLFYEEDVIKGSGKSYQPGQEK